MQEEQMTLSEYMKLRNGCGKGGSPKYAMTNAEFKYLGIVNTKGWPKRYQDVEISNEEINHLSNLAKGVKQSCGKLTNRIDVNLLNVNNDKYLYLMVNENGRHKIGISKNPKDRAKSLSTGSGYHTKLIAYWNVQGLVSDVEKYLLTKFVKFNTLGEWFNFPHDFNIIGEIENSFTCNFERVIG